MEKLSVLCMRMRSKEKDLEIVKESGSPEKEYRVTPSWKVKEDMRTL